MLRRLFQRENSEERLQQIAEDHSAAGPERQAAREELERRQAARARAQNVTMNPMLQSFPAPGRSAAAPALGYTVNPAALGSRANRARRASQVPVIAVAPAASAGVAAPAPAPSPADGLAQRLGAFAGVAAGLAGPAAAVPEYTGEDLGVDMFGDAQGNIVFPGERPADLTFGEVSRRVAEVAEEEDWDDDQRLDFINEYYRGLPENDRGVIRDFTTSVFRMFGNRAYISVEGGIPSINITEERTRGEDPSGMAAAARRAEYDVDVEEAEDPTGSGKRALLNRRRQELMRAKHRR
jgi:hypothetical protein